MLGFFLEDVLHDLRHEGIWQGYGVVGFRSRE